MNTGLDTLYSGSPRDVLRRYELVLETIPTFQDAVYDARRYETWYKYVVLRNQLRRQIERMYVNKEFEDIGKDVDLQALGIRFGEFNDTFPKHVFYNSNELVDEPPPSIEWFDEEIPEAMKVIIKYIKFETHEGVRVFDRIITHRITLSRFATGNYLWNMVLNIHNEEFAEGRLDQLVLIYNGPNLAWIDRDTETPLIALGIQDGTQFRLARLTN